MVQRIVTQAYEIPMYEPVEPTSFRAYVLLNAEPCRYWMGMEVLMWYDKSHSRFVQSPDGARNLLGTCVLYGLCGSRRSKIGCIEAADTYMHACMERRWLLPVGVWMWVWMWMPLDGILEIYYSYRQKVCKSIKPTRTILWSVMVDIFYFVQPPELHTSGDTSTRLG